VSPECALNICDGTGWIDSDPPEDFTRRCPCPAGREPSAEPPADLHDRIMGAIREELQAKREAQQAIHRYHNGGGR
jgi:broad specificity phosphatase PhoE